MATRKKRTPTKDQAPRNPRVVFSIVESTTRRDGLSVRLNPNDRTATAFVDMLVRAGFKAGDRVLMVLAPETSGKTINELIAASSLGTPGAVALRKRGIRPTQMDRDLEEMEADTLRNEGRAKR